MFDLKILETAIGVIFVYIILSMLCSSIREAIEAWLKTRAAHLEYGIRELLNDKKANGIAKSLYDHPLINCLFPREYGPDASDKPPSILASGANLPSYIPAKNFATALMDIAARGPSTDAVSSDPTSPAASLDSIRKNLLNLNNQAVQRALLTAIDSAQGDFDKARANIEDWYNSAMDRVSGRYKRGTHWVLFWIGLVLAVGLNANTITIADYLYRNDATRAAVVAKAEKAKADQSSSSPDFDKTIKELENLGLPLGWSLGWGAPRRHGEPGSDAVLKDWVWNDWVYPIFGWLMTAFAMTMGAPFWFDVLNKVMVIRSTVKPHEKSPEEASEDRQLPAKPATEAGAAAPPAGPAGPVAPPAAPIPPLQLVERAASPRDDESSIDGCDVDTKDSTPDEELPPAEGGVA